MMSNFYDTPFADGHDHVFLGAGHDSNERKTWAVIALCSVMMVVEIAGGTLFGSLALVADGLHMSTHACAMLIAALAYTFARKHASDRRFVFGTGKLGDLAGFTSAIILAMIAVLIGYEAIARFLAPVPISFTEAIPIAVVGLMVNIASAWLLSGDDHHGHSHGHSHGGEHAAHPHAAVAQAIVTGGGVWRLEIFEDGVPPVFRLAAPAGSAAVSAAALKATLKRPDQTREVFQFAARAGYFESTRDIPEPHAFDVVLTLPDGDYHATFAEHQHDAHEAHDAHGAVDSRDHNIRAA